MPEFLPYEGDANNFPGVAQPKSNKVVYPPRTNIKVNGLIVGFIMQLDVNETARVERIRHMNFADAGRIVEQIEGPVDYTLNVRGFVLYGSDTLARITGEATGSEESPSFPLGTTGGTVIPSLEWISKKRPDITTEFIHPGNPDVKFEITYHKCAVTGRSSTINLADLFITETVNLQPTFKTGSTKVNTVSEPMPLMGEDE